MNQFKFSLYIARNDMQFVRTSCVS